MLLRLAATLLELAVTFCKTYVLDYIYSPLHHNHVYMNFPLPLWGRGIWNALSQAIVLILLKIKLNAQPQHCAFFFSVSNGDHLCFSFTIVGLSSLLESVECVICKETVLAPFVIIAWLYVSAQWTSAKGVRHKSILETEQGSTFFSENVAHHWETEGRSEGRSGGNFKSASLPY